MENAAVAIPFFCLLAGELLILCFNLSKLRVESGKRHEELKSVLSEISKSLAGKANKT